MLRLGLKIKARFDPSKKIQDPLYRLKQFILRLSQQWAKYRLWLVEPGVPSTNNRTEQAIGRPKAVGPGRSAVLRPLPASNRRSS